MVFVLHRLVTMHMSKGNTCSFFAFPNTTTRQQRVQAMDSASKIRNDIRGCDNRGRCTPISRF